MKLKGRGQVTVQETWPVCVFCSTSSSYSLELVEPPVCAHLLWARRMDGGFGGEEVTVLAHALRGQHCSNSPAFWERDTSETHHLLAAVSTWLATGLGWELAALAGELEAKLGMEATPNPTGAWPQTSTATSTGRGPGWLTEEGTLPSRSSHQTA